MFDYYRLRFSLLKEGWSPATKFDLRPVIIGGGGALCVFSIFLVGGYALLAFFGVTTLLFIAQVTEDHPRYGRLVVGCVATLSCLALLWWYVAFKLLVIWARPYPYRMMELEWWQRSLIRDGYKFDVFIALAAIYLAAVGFCGIRNHFLLRRSATAPNDRN